MGRDCSDDVAVGLANYLVCPDVADIEQAVIQFGDVHEIVVEVPAVFSSVQEADGPLIIGKLLHPYLLVAHIHRDVRLNTKRILVDSDSFLVGENSQNLRFHRTEIVT